MFANKQMRNLLVVFIALIAAIGLGVWTVSAQGPNSNPDTNTPPWGGGHMGQGMWGQPDNNSSDMWGMMGRYNQQGHMMPGHMGQGTWEQQGSYDMWNMMGSQPMLEATAAALNLEPAAMTAQLQSGKTLSEIAAEQGIEPQALTEAILAERQTYLNLMVEQGYLTQEQADAMLMYMTQNLAGHLDWMFSGNGWGTNSWGYHCGW